VVPIIGTASDANLAGWQLDYYIPSTQSWQPIDSGGTAVVNGLLGTWDTTTLAPCYYTLRLRVWDDSILNTCTSGGAQQYKEDFLSVAVGDVQCRGDVNGDGTVNWRDIDPFIELMNTTCP
jgi:hypothetical protein